jgi:hypothetical protein
MTAAPDDGVKVVFRTPTGEPLTLDEQKSAEVRARIETLRSALSVVRQIDPTLREVSSVTSELERFDREIAALREPSAIEIRLDAAEDLLMAASARIPFQRLRTKFQGITFSDAELLGFLTLLERVSTTAEYHDRVELFVTRLCRAPDRDDVRPFDEVADLLAQFLSPERCSEEKRRQAIEFFVQARERLAALTSIDSIFDSGFYIDLKGYKIALRSDYFDPEVLHAAAAVSIASEAKVRSLLVADSQSGQGLDDRFERTRDKVREAFGEKLPEFRGGLTARIRQRRPSLDPETIVREEPPPPPRVKRTSRTRIAVGLLVIALVVGAFSLRQIWQVRERDMSEIAGARLGTLSPLLVSGSYGGGEDARVFTGQVDPARWDALNQTERRDHLRELARNLGDVRAAQVYRGDALVGQIVNGNVRFVE